MRKIERDESHRASEREARREKERRRRGERNFPRARGVAGSRGEHPRTRTMAPAAKGPARRPPLAGFFGPRSGQPRAERKGSAAPAEREPRDGGQGAENPQPPNVGGGVSPVCSLNQVLPPLSARGRRLRLRAAIIVPFGTLSRERRRAGGAGKTALEKCFGMPFEVMANFDLSLCSPAESAKDA